jgi:glycerophosphoryl diester phosphodiesterase
MKSILPLTFAAAVAAYPTSQKHETPYLVSLGPRPYYIINNMTDGPLKHKLQSCENKPVAISDFSIAHRGGGTLQFPEETVQSEEAGARMGAGILECDVSFTSDRGLVCRHSLCDLHTTTDILLRPELAKKCSQPFTPANATSPANALCCTSDITMAECMLAFKLSRLVHLLTSTSQHPLRQTRWLQRLRHYALGLPSRHSQLAH